jgi:hypothetical protein
MRKITLKNLVSIAIIIFTISLNAQTDNLISLKATGTGSEGNALIVDSADIIIDASGNVTLSNIDWEFLSDTGKMTFSNALSTTISISTKGVFDVSQLDDETFGDIITGGGIDRAGAGDLGIRNPDDLAGRGNGIDFDEGFVFGLNAENLSPTITLQISGISFSGLSGTEIATVVARTQAAPKPRMTFDTTKNGFQDVTSLNLYVTGGESKLNLVSIFNSVDVSGGNFRIVGLRIKVIETSTLSVSDNNFFSNNFTLDSNPVSDMISISYNAANFKEVNASLIDINGRVLQQKNTSSLTTNKIEFNANKLSKGIYFVRIQSDGKNTTKKIIKQ